MNQTSQAIDLQPQWTQTGKSDGEQACTYYPSRKGPQRNAGQRIIGKTRDGKLASAPHLPYRNMLDPSGNVCFVAISTNRDLTQFNDRYEKVTTAIRQEKGWVHWDWEPKREPVQLALQVRLGSEQAAREAWPLEREKLREKHCEQARLESSQFDALGQSQVSEILKAVRLQADAQGSALEGLMQRILDRLLQGDVAGAGELAGVKPPKKG